MTGFDFSSIEPYTPNEVPKAIIRLAHNPMFGRWVRTMNPNVDAEAFASLMECITTCDEFQYMVMRPLVYQIAKRSMDNFTYSGLENIKKNETYLFVSNHRDITLDAALLDVILLSNGIKTPEIGFGNNLMKNEMIVDIFRLNKMFTIIRDGSRREFYNNSVFLSNYIQHVLFEKNNSVWIAQRNGRTKDGDDKTDQGLLKMFSMAGTGDFEADFNKLKIVPVAISYEYEPCGTIKALTTYTSMMGIYEKTQHEDLLSIMMGISQYKGNVHINICKPISEEEVADCNRLNKNEKYTALAHIIDDRIHSGYKLHKTNYIAADMLGDEVSYDEHYSTEDLEKFITFADNVQFQGPSMAAKDKLMDILLDMYAKPVINAEKVKTDN